MLSQLYLLQVSDNNAVKNGLYKVDNDKSTSKPANPESACEVVNKPASLKSDQMDCKFAEILSEELIHVQSINSKSEKLVAYKQLEDPTVDLFVLDDGSSWHCGRQSHILLMILCLSGSLSTSRSSANSM